jgi:hypothetical protein
VVIDLGDKIIESGLLFGCELSFFGSASGVNRSGFSKLCDAFCAQCFNFVH